LICERDKLNATFTRRLIQAIDWTASCMTSHPSTSWSLGALGNDNNENVFDSSRLPLLGVHAGNG
jgi:hypothetical protein